MKFWGLFGKREKPEEGPPSPFPGLTAEQARTLQEIAADRGAEAAARAALVKAREHVDRGQESVDILKWTQDPRLVPALRKNRQLAETLGRKVDDPRLVPYLSQIVLERAQVSERQAQGFADAADYYRSLAEGGQPPRPGEDDGWGGGPGGAPVR